MPDGKSVIWCSSFQIAWNRLRDDLAKGPVRLQNAQAIADRLNRAEQSEADLSPDEFYAAAGWVKDGIAERIRREMGQKFPKVPLSELDTPNAAGVAYAYLQAQAKFSLPFFDNPARLVFRTSSGTEIPVSSFGIPEREYAGGKSLRDQVAILLLEHHADKEDVAEGFALDLDKNSMPNQLILARVARKRTLHEMLAELKGKVAAYKPAPFDREFLPQDTLLVPNMRLRFQHHFAELEGTDKLFSNPGMKGLWLSTAVQDIKFEMHKGGAELASEAAIAVKSRWGIAFRFDQPFLLVMKKRSAAQPFLVIWVDGGELLEKL
jgi:hypothetical protein